MLVNGNNFTIGADPEVFVKFEGSFVSAHNLLPGDKENPYIVPNGAVQVDGMAAEFNIDPANNYDEFSRNLDSVQSTLSKMIGNHELLKQVSVEFDEEFASKVPDINRVLGCSSDFNGWTEEENPSPDGEAMMRTAGGHVHIGGFTSENAFDYAHYLRCARLARILDYTLGVYSILWDKDDKRRDMYGQAGAFRPKTYGMEYRSLSNAWIFDKGLTRFVYDGVEEALKLMMDKSFVPDKQVQKIINTSMRDSPFFKNNKKALILGYA